MQAKPLILLIPLLILSACSSIDTFEKPDIRNEFCGIHINYQFCKCAFHGDFCESIGMDEEAAEAYVYNEYEQWTAQLLEDWLAACVLSGGIAGTNTCEHCDEGMIAKNGQCVEQSETSTASTTFEPDGPLDKDCHIIEDEFSQDWRKYSDIDSRIPYEERSYEAKQSVDAYDEMIDAMIEAFALERDIEIEEQMQAELLEYRSALVNNIQTNLLKAFWRLSWVTYSTAKAGTGLGKSYSKVLTTGASAETIGAGLKVVQGITPKDSALAIDKSTLTGKAASVGAKTALTAIDTLGDPTKIATDLFKNAANAALPSADISEEEINILREQHLEQGIIDEALAQSQTENAARKSRLNDLEQRISTLQSTIEDWEAKERNRVQLMLEESCKDLKSQRQRT